MYICSVSPYKHKILHRKNKGLLAPDFFRAGLLVIFGETFIMASQGPFLYPFCKIAFASP